MKQVNAKKIDHNGLERWRVCIPLDLQPQIGVSRKFFADKSEADAFVKKVNGSRQSWVSRLLGLGDDDQGKLIRALDVAGSAAELVAAADHWVQVRARTRMELGKAAAEYLATVERRGVSRSHYRQQEVILDRLVSSRASRMVCSMDAAELQSWLDSQPGEAKTIDNCRIAVCSFFRWAHLRGYCTSNQMLTVKAPKSDSEEIHILSLDEIKHLLRTAAQVAPESLAYFACGIFGGLRVAELQRLTPELFVVEDSKPWIHVTKKVGKQGRARFVTVYPVLQSWLAIAPTKSTKIKRTTLDKVRRAAGYALRPGDEGRPWRSNCMRHSFASYMAPVVGIRQCAKDAGHSEVIQEAHYRALVSDSLAQVFQSLTAELVLQSPSNVVSMPAA